VAHVVRRAAAFVGLLMKEADFVHDLPTS
jgi:hypothetical protein